MRFPPAPARFTDRITAVGTLSLGGKSAGPLDCLIDVSNVARHGIVGWVLGNQQTKEQIARAQGRGGPMRLQATSGSEGVTSERVWIRRMQSFDVSADQMPHGLVGIACEFECLDLTRRLDMGGERGEAREVRFLLTGPSGAGLVASSRRRSFDGSARVEVHDSRLALGGGLPFSMSVLPHFFYSDEAGEQGSLPRENRNSRHAAETAETHVVALACRTRKLPDAYDDDRFLEEARRAAEDVCLLLSLLAGGMITWHAYYQSAEGFSRQHNRSLAGPRDEGRGEEIVNRSHLRSFLATAFRRLRRMREKGIDLEMPLIYAVAGAEARVARQRFGEFFIALEALHSIYLASHGAAFLLDKRMFRKVQKELKANLGLALRRQGIRWRKACELMASKLGELNRPSFWHGVQSLMERLRVDWEDLYPEPTPDRPTFINLRNSLFHSHKRVDDETVYKESVRLEAIVNRVLLRWLGWEDLWAAPPPHVRHYLAGKALPDRHRLGGRQRRGKKRGDDISAPGGSGGVMPRNGNRG